MAVATHLADKSALTRLDRRPVAARLVPMLEAGLVASCPVVDLEVLFSTRDGPQYVEVARDRRIAYERLPMPDEVWDRALEVQGELAARGQHRAVSIPDLLIAATAERHALTVLHYDADFDLVASVTAQPTEWVVPRGSVA